MLDKEYCNKKLVDEAFSAESIDFVNDRLQNIRSCYNSNDRNKNNYSLGSEFKKNKRFCTSFDCAFL